MAWSVASATQCTLIAADRGRPKRGIEGSPRPSICRVCHTPGQSMSVPARNLRANRHRRQPLQRKPPAPFPAIQRF